MVEQFKCDCCGLCCHHVGKYQDMKEYDRGDGICMYLNKDNKCDIYETRPLICNVRKLYEKVFANKYTWDEFLELQYNACKQLKQEGK